jgi:hypothetical protein
MHRHYVHLGNAERQRIRDARNERFLQAQAQVERRRRVLPESFQSPILQDRREVEGVRAVGIGALPVVGALYYPQYDSPPPVVGQNPLGLAPAAPALVRRNMDHLRNINLADIAPQNLHNLFEDIIVANRIQLEETERRKTTVQLHMEPARFESKSASDECPVCYESADNMVLTKCDHLFCQTCMLNMIRLNCYNLSCALCRSSVKDIYVHSEESMDLMFHA